MGPGFGGWRACRAFALALAIACGGADGEPGPVALSGLADARYDVRVELAPESGDGSPALHVRVEPSPGWHLEPDAPATLALETAGRGRLEPARQRGEDALRRSEQVLEFAAAVEGAGALPVTGRLKFGICEGDAELCSIVRRDLAFTVRLPAP